VLRYYIISACIVLGAAVLATAWAQRDLIRIKIASVNTPMSPKPEPSTTFGGASTKPLHGDAPWALSALPACLEQVSEVTGPSAYVLAHLPSGAVPVDPPASLVYGDCTISIAGGEAYVRRGGDRFHIPPTVRFYRAPGALVLLRIENNGNELRVYRPTANQ
jgi:hypothetical protein